MSGSLETASFLQSVCQQGREAGKEQVANHKGQKKKPQIKRSLIRSQIKPCKKDGEPDVKVFGKHPT